MSDDVPNANQARGDAQADDPAAAADAAGGIAKPAVEEEKEFVWRDIDLPDGNSIEAYLSELGPQTVDNITFNARQIESIEKVINRFDDYDAVIFKAYMGAGKTYMSVAIMYYLRRKAGHDSKKIIIICPNKLSGQWKKYWGKGRMSNIEFWEFDEFLQKAKDVNYTKQSYIIFDECHKIRTLCQGLNDTEAERVCRFVGTHGIKRLGLTGTLIYYDRDDLLYEVNSFVGTDEKERWPLPFTWTHLTNIYRDTEGDTYGFYNALRSIFGGWIFNLERLRVYPIPDFIALADIGDFYLNQYGPYVDPKRAIVSDIARSIPGFDPAVLSPKLKDLVIKGPLTVLSVMAFTTMMNPFSYLIPTIFTLVQIENQNAFNDLDKEAIQNKVCHVIVDMPNIDVDERSSVVSGLIQKIGWLGGQADVAMGKVRKWKDESADDPKPAPVMCKEIVYKWPAIKQFSDANGDPVNDKIDKENVFITMCHRFENVDYTWNQLQLFVRFTNNRLTPTDAKLLGIAESKRTMTRALNMHDLETTGLIIGSVQFTPDDLDSISKEDKQRKNQFRDDFKKRVGASEEQKADQNAPATVASVAVVPSVAVVDVAAVPDTNQVPKFDNAIARIKDSDGRVVVFSQFKDVLRRFRTYCTQETEFKFYDADDEANKAKERFNYEARTELTQSSNKKFIMTLSADRADGYDGLENVDTMLILEPCTTDSMKRQLIARVVRQKAHSDSRRVRVFEYMCTPGFANIKRIGASMMDWWQHDKRVAYWVFEPLLDNTRTPDQVVARSQEVSGEMENLCSDFKDEVKKGVHHKVKKAFQQSNGRERIREALYGKYNFDILENERRELRNKLKDVNNKSKWTDNLQYKRTNAILQAQLDKLIQERPSDDMITKIKHELGLPALQAS